MARQRSQRVETTSSKGSKSSKGAPPSGARAHRALASLGGALLAVMLGCGGAGEGQPAAPGVEQTGVAELAISPSNPQLAQGSAQAFAVRGLLANGRTQDLTAQVRWSVRDSAGAQVAVPADGLWQFARPGRYSVTVEYAGRSQTTAVTVTTATLSSISVAPSMPQVPKGLTKAFTATAHFSDGTTQDVTKMSAWSVKDVTGTGVALIDSTGLATAKAVGKTRVSARYMSKTSSTVLEVTPAALVTLAVSPSNPTIAKGTSLSFSAVGTYTDGGVLDLTSIVTWSVADVMGSAVAAIDGSGTAFGQNVGTATVSAELGGTVTETLLTVNAATVVSLTLSPSDASIAQGLTQQFTAVALLSDGMSQDVTRLAAWSATDSMGMGVAAIDGNGLAKGNSVGKAAIRCAYSGQVAAGTLTVTPAVIVGFAVDPTTASITKGLSKKLRALGTFSDGTVQDLSPVATWQASDVMGTSVASVDGTGLVQAKAIGRARIEARYGLRAASALIDVTAATVVSLAVTPSSAVIARGAKQAFTARATLTDATVVDVTTVATWTVSDVSGTGVASIDMTGVATGTAEGRAQVRAIYSGAAATANITVPAFAPVPTGTTNALRRMWGSSDSNIWAAGWLGTLLHYNGSTWSSVSIGTGEYLYAIWGSSANDIWVAGSGGRAWHFNGTAWISTSLGISGDVSELWGSGPSDVWAASPSALVHWNGTSWSATSVSGFTSYSLWGSAASDIWAVGPSNQAAHYNGTSWSASTLPGDSGTAFDTIVGTGSRDIWAGGQNGNLVHYDGTSWRKVSIPTTSYLVSMQARSATDAWAVGLSGVILHYDGTSWAQVLSPTPGDLFGVWLAPSAIWVCGADGIMLKK